MKLEPVTKPDKGKKAASKNLTMTSCHHILTSLPIFQFMANLEQLGSWIPDVWSAVLTFLLIATFYLTKTENRTKNFQTELSYY